MAATADQLAVMVTGVIPAIRETVAGLVPARVPGLGRLSVPSGG